MTSPGSPTTPPRSRPRSSATPSSRTCSCVVCSGPPGLGGSLHTGLSYTEFTYGVDDTLQITRSSDVLPEEEVAALQP